MSFPNGKASLSLDWHSYFPFPCPQIDRASRRRSSTMQFFRNPFRAMSFPFSPLLQGGPQRTFFATNNFANSCTPPSPSACFTTAGI